MSNDNSYGSIEHLMEFGMSMAIAQQMMQTMNNAMQNMSTPQFKNTNVPLPQPIHFYALVNDIPQGPLTETELSSHILAKRISEETMIWHGGIPGWMLAKQIPEVAKFFSLMPPQLK